MAAMLVAAGTATANGQCESQVLHNPGAAAADEFGAAVAVSELVALVGAPFDDETASDAGAAAAFRFNPVSGAWIGQARLVATDGASGDQFGAAVALEDDLAVVGAPRHDATAGNAGAAYVFRFNVRTGAWDQEAKLLASDGAVADFFGTSVAVSGNAIVVGAYLDDDLGTESGAAYVFRYDDTAGAWDQEAKLLPVDGAVRDRFGWSVAISSDVIVVGAYQDDDNGSNSGSAYVFRFDASKSNWFEEFKLVPADGDAADRFGFSVAARGDAAVAGAYLDNDHGADSGSAYVFRYDASAGIWFEEAKLVPDDGAAMDFFGRAVSLGDDVALIGASRDDDMGADSGSAYLYQYDGAAWLPAAKIIGAAALPDDRFGDAVALDTEWAFVGAPFADDFGTQSGSAYMFGDLNPPDCNGNGTADGCDIVIGISLDEDGDGVPDECASVPGDLDGDGIVGFGDLVNLLDDWGPCPDGDDCPSDLNGDGVVNILDLLVLLGLW